MGGTLGGLIDEIRRTMEHGGSIETTEFPLVEAPLSGRWERFKAFWLGWPLTKTERGLGRVLIKVFQSPGKPENQFYILDIVNIARPAGLRVDVEFVTRW